MTMIPEAISKRVEQLSSATDPQPRGEDRAETGESRGMLSHLFGYTNRSSDRVTAESRNAPKNLNENWEKYYEGFALTRAPLKDFGDAVAEPGYQITVRDGDGERDEEMEQALELWAQNCLIHAGEAGRDIRNLFGSIPAHRRGKGTVLVEKVRGRDGTLAGLMPLDPATFKIHTRERQPLIIQPDDEVGRKHPRTPDGKAAGYTQYHESLKGYGDKDAIHFAADEIIKFVYDPDHGDIWGTSVFDAIDDRIDALIQKLEDRDYSIRQVGYAHRIYSSENWTQEEAKEYAEAHKDGDVSANYGPDDDDSLGGEKTSFAGRVDFVSDTVDVQVESGNIPDLEDPIRDDVEQIFAVMPVGKYEIAYADDLNQFVVQPQIEKDNERVDGERRYLERKIRPVFEEKADELADGDEYDGEVTLSIEPPKDENPLRRESFPDENLEAFASAWKAYAESGADIYLPPEAFADLAGVDLNELKERYDWQPDELGDIGEETTGEED